MRQTSFSSRRGNVATSDYWLFGVEMYSTIVTAYDYQTTKNGGRHINERLLVYNLAEGSDKSEKIEVPQESSTRYDGEHELS